MNIYQIIITIVVIIGVCGSVGFLFPLSNKVSRATGILDLIDKLGIKSTKAAQQLAISSQLPLEQRKEKAKESIKEGLAAFKITITPKLEKVIDDTIQEMVFDSKAPEEQRNQCQKALLEQISQLQVQISQLATEKSQLEAQNAQL
ncbi:hypothetical protein [Clostridium kluyveri]|uniref:Uncharacterized protein n=2 Tax=Clostridium kluyveri TaxID=1534 RepID=A5N5Q9_CLOK5|nr:hypothetical protein [Clostridium kluyveri]EDK32640.1 Conserved hypothetical protein [Clostridium kluyveri DSM 555]BAH05569.1 hypothetical protein CKR_0518 [Clostridium kluyveri NBRC 12016]